MSCDIFISHSSKDAEVAQRICRDLEGRGFGCWIASRDVRAGEIFSEAIVRAIRSARIMLLVFTQNANDSDEIKKELALASQSRLVVIPIRVEDVRPGDAFAYEFAIRQWIDMFPEWIEGFEKLNDRLSGLLNGEQGQPKPGERVRATSPGSYPGPRPRPRLRASAAAPAQGIMAWSPLLALAAGWVLTALAFAGFARLLDILNSPIDTSRLSRAKIEALVLLVPSLLILATGVTGILVVRQSRFGLAVGPWICCLGFAWSLTLAPLFVSPAGVYGAAIGFGASLVGLLIHRHARPATQAA